MNITWLYYIKIKFSKMLHFAELKSRFLRTLPQTMPVKAAFTNIADKLSVVAHAASPSKQGPQAATSGLDRPSAQAALGKSHHNRGKSADRHNLLGGGRNMRSSLTIQVGGEVL